MFVLWRFFKGRRKVSREASSLEKKFNPRPHASSRYHLLFRHSTSFHLLYLSRLGFPRLETKYLTRAMKSEVRKRKNCEDERTDKTVEGRGRESTNLCSDPPVKVERARLLERNRREDRYGLMGKCSA